MLYKVQVYIFSSIFSYVTVYTCKHDYLCYFFSVKKHKSGKMIFKLGIKIYITFKISKWKFRFIWSDMCKYCPHAVYNTKCRKIQNLSIVKKTYSFITKTFSQVKMSSQNYFSFKILTIISVGTSRNEYMGLFGISRLLRSSKTAG